MIARIVLAVVVAVVVTIVCVGLLGPILDDLRVSIATTLGRFLIAWGGAIGILAGLWYYFAGDALLHR
jgi:hypothetical protein